MKIINDIIFIEECHSLPDDESRWNNEWGRQIVFSHGSNSSRRVAVLFKPTFSCNCTKSFSDTGGRYVVLDMTYCDIILTIVNVYGPNIDDPNFYDILSSDLQCFTCTNVICGGDFNFIFNLDLDKLGGIPRTNFKARDHCVYHLSRCMTWLTSGEKGTHCIKLLHGVLNDDNLLPL